MGDRSKAQGYDAFYEEFDPPLMRQLRLEAYGEDIGQHSWVTADDLRRDVVRLRLSSSSRLIDLGCGPCGPLTFIGSAVGCAVTGTELSAAALEVGRARAVKMGVDRQLVLREADLNGPIAFPSASFDAATALDVVLHVRDRTAMFAEVRRILTPGGRFLFTDAGVVTGSVSNEEIELRSVHGHTQFSAPGFNERALEITGFRLLETEDRTAGALKNASGRLAARLAHRAELVALEGAGGFELQQRYLETVIELSRRRAVSRIMYLAESLAD